MRRLDKEIIDQELIETILTQSELCRLGLVDNGEAYIVPMNYAYSEGIIYLHSALLGRKMEILSRNNKVSFEITYSSRIIENDVPCNWSTRYRSVMGTGTIEFENNIDEKCAILDMIMLKYGAMPDKLLYDSAVVARVAVLKLKIETLTAKQSGKWD